MESGEWTDPPDTVLVEQSCPRLGRETLYDFRARGSGHLVAVTRAGVLRLDLAAMVGQDGDVITS